MKWYWILLIVLAVIAVGILIARAVRKKNGASLPAVTKTVITAPAVETGAKPSTTTVQVTPP